MEKEELKERKFERKVSNIFAIIILIITLSLGIIALYKKMNDLYYFLISFSGIIYILVYTFFILGNYKNEYKIFLRTVAPTVAILIVLSTHILFK